MTDPGSPLVDFIRIMAILGGILLLAWTGVRYWVAPRMPRVSGLRDGVIEVVAKQQLDPRNTLYVIKAGDEHLLVSASDAGGVNLLREVSVNPAAESTAIVERPGSFADWLRKVQNKKAES